MKRHIFASGCNIAIVVLCTVLLLLSLGSVGGIGRTRAKELLCRSHLRQWASIFDSFTQDNNGFFFSAEPADSDGWWIEPLWSYHEDAGLLACPAATDTSLCVLPTHRAWAIGRYAGSYGLNGWVGNRHEDVAGHRSAYADDHWPTPRVWGAAHIPVLAEMFWADAWPYEMDHPQEMEQSLTVHEIFEMQRVCVNRHAGSTNFLFMDGSVRKVGLKEIWALKWNRMYNACGPWTVAGGVWSVDWPEWMRQFKEFYNADLEQEL